MTSLVNNQQDDFEPDDFEPEVVEQPTDDFQQDDFEPEKEKAGKFKSALLGLYEGVLAAPALIQYGVNEFSKGIEQGYYGDEAPKLSFQEENPLLAHMATLPESEGEGARRLRVAGQALPLSATGGIPLIIAGLVGSQAGQTVREVYGKEGKFENFGLGEVAAIGLDIAVGAGAGLGASLARSGGKTAVKGATKVPSIFTNPKTGMERKIVQVAVQSEENALNDVINNFSKSQVQGFEKEASRISPNKFTDLTESSASAIQRDAENMFRNTQLSIISPLEATTEQGGRAIQEAAEATFQNNVIAAERAAYAEGNVAAQGLSGTAPKTLKQAKELRAQMTVNNPTPEQKATLSFLDGLIADLETVTPASTKPASKVLDASGKPIVAAQEVPAVAKPTKKKANDLVNLVQNSNQAISYDSQVRAQSHRLKPIIATLREETGAVLAKKPEAKAAYDAANLLHARNAEVWGTKYMRQVRFAENPEAIIQSSSKASNMRNLKQAVQDPTIQGLAERMVVDNMTKSGGPKANRVSLRNLSPELTPQARGAAENLINVKDPLTTTGGRAAVVNDILKDAAKAVNTGQRPEKILKLMQTQKGYRIVKDALNRTPRSRELLKSFERLFLEDFVSSITDGSGMIDFKKARQIFNNAETKEVLQQIGGDNLIKRFNQLEQFSNNLERNISLYSKPEVQSLFKQIIGEGAKSIPLGILLHAVHVPWPVIVGLGLGKAAGKVGKIGYQALEKRILSNPKAIHYLEQLSQAKTVEEVAKQLPRLAAELDKGD